MSAKGSVMKGTTYPELHWTPPMIARFWDWQSQYPETYFTYIFGGEIARSLRRYLVGRQTVLDLGCGVGHLLPHICRYARCVYGADISDQSIARANARFSGTKAFAGAFTPTQLRSQQTRF